MTANKWEESNLWTDEERSALLTNSCHASSVLGSCGMPSAGAVRQGGQGVMGHMGFLLVTWGVSRLHNSPSNSVLMSLLESLMGFVRFPPWNLTRMSEGSKHRLSWNKQNGLLEQIFPGWAFHIQTSSCWNVSICSSRPAQGFFFCTVCVQSA